MTQHNSFEEGHDMMAETLAKKTWTRATPGLPRKPEHEYLHLFLGFVVTVLSLFAFIYYKWSMSSSKSSWVQYQLCKI